MALGGGATFGFELSAATDFLSITVYYYSIVIDVCGRQSVECIFSINQKKISPMLQQLGLLAAGNGFCPLVSLARTVRVGFRIAWIDQIK